MHAASINTTAAAARVLFTPNPIVGQVCIMLRVSLVLCVAPAVFGIIVRDPPPSPNDYKYSYNIDDPTTGDSKSQHEVRQGDVVTGAYTVLGADGTKRTVEYTADAKHGFKAVVREDPASPPLNHPSVPQHNYNTINAIQYQPTPKPVYVQYLTPAPSPEFVKYQTPAPSPQYIQYQTPNPRPEYVQFQTSTPRPEYVQYQTSTPRPEYVQYQTTAPRPAYEPVLHPDPQSNYVEEQPTIFFTPQNEVEPRATFDGQYFIPATVNNKY